MATAIIVFTLLLVSWFIWRQYSKHASLLQLGIIFAANLAIGYPIRLLVVAQSDSVVTEWPLNAYRAQLFELSVICLIGLALFFLGYTLADGRRGKLTFLRSASITPEQQFPSSLIWFLFSVSILGKFLKFATGNYIAFLLAEGAELAYANVLENLHRVGWVAFAVICILAFQGKIYRRSDWVLLWAVVGVEVLYQVIQGSKTFLMLPLFILAICYYYAKNRIPIIVGVIAIFFMTFFVFPFVNAYREVLQAHYRQGIPSFSELDAVAVISETFRVAFLDSAETSAIGAEPSTIGATFQRFGAADELLRFIEVVPEQLPYKHGADFLGVLVSAIPRAVWPEKPIFSPGADYGLWLDTITSVTPFPLGEMYWNGGYVGVVLGMFLWGVMLALAMRLTARLFHARGAQLYVVGIYLAELYWYTSTESMLPIIMASLVQKVIIYYALFTAYAVAFMRRHNSRILAGNQLTKHPR